MASNHPVQQQQPTPKVQQLIKSDHWMFAASDDGVTMKQIQGTHSPDGRKVDVKPILEVIEDIFRRAAPGIEGVIKGAHGHVDTLEDKTAVVGNEGTREALVYIIKKISCELSCKCDAHTTTVAIFNLLTNYSWDAKVVISLAAFAVNYGDFWLVAQLCATDPLAKSLSLLKLLPDIIEHSGSFKPRFDTINDLFKVILNVTKRIIEFNELPPQYISPETPMSAYWTIHTMVACASQITSLLGMSYEHLTSTTEEWELPSLRAKLGKIHDQLKEQLSICSQFKDVEIYQKLVRLFEETQDNMKILKALISSKDDLQPLLNGTTRTRVNIEVLRRKTVLLLISDLDINREELGILDQINEDKRTRSDICYEIVWLPIVDRSTPWNDENQQKFKKLQATMTWYTVAHPLLDEPAVIRYIKEVWHFSKKHMLVVLDPLGKVVNPDALHMVMIWGEGAYPFTTAREETLWKEETWKLELLVDRIDTTIPEWRGKFICLYGGEDIEWIRQFTAEAKKIALTASITLEMVYVGKSKAKERVQKITKIINEEQLSSCLPYPKSILFFWTRLESMWYSKTQHGKTFENDRILQEVLTLLSFDGSDQGWAIICKGSTEMARANGKTFLKSFYEFPTWEEDVKNKGFVSALNVKLDQLHSPEHCYRLILPGISGRIPEKVVCAECGKPMEKYFMYRCCTD